MSITLAPATSEAPRPRLDLLAKSKYVLTSDAEEERRMESQHQLMKAVYPHPLPASFSPQSTDAILESGAGTGAWAIEVASLLPTAASVTGIDIHDKWFPLNKPQNVNFEVQSITDLPVEWSSAFNLVHQRFLTFALGLSDWKQAVSEMYRVLRPGGWIVLEEFEVRFTNSAKDYEKDLTNTYMVERYVELICERKQLLCNSPDVLEELVTQAGFSEIQVTKTLYEYGPGDALEEQRENIIGVWLRLRNALVKTGVDEHELDRTTVGFRNEMRNHAIGLPWYRLVARKL